jgi:hypothetical protein
VTKGSGFVFHGLSERHSAAAPAGADETRIGALLQNRITMT